MQDVGGFGGLGCVKGKSLKQSGNECHVAAFLDCICLIVLKTLLKLVIICLNTRIVSMQDSTLYAGR